MRLVIGTEITIGPASHKAKLYGIMITSKFFIGIVKSSKAKGD